MRKQDMLTTNNFKMEYIHSGLFSSTSIWIHPRRSEVTYELICIISGDVFMEEDGEKYHLTKNDVIILKPGCEHSGYLESTPPVSFYWIHFNIDDFEKCNIKTRYIRNYTNSFQFKNLLNAANHPMYPEGSAEAILLTILNDLSFFTHRFNSDEYKILYEAAEWIRINSSTMKIYTDDVAKKFDKNPQYFSRLFKKQYSIGLKEYICQERLNAVKSFLCNTNLSIKEIAAIMNFENENEFINYFKYHMKTSPQRFRNYLSHIHMNNR